MSKKTDWVASGAPTQLTDFLDAAVGQMHQKAVANDTISKEKGDQGEVDPVAAGMNSILDDTPSGSVQKDGNTAEENDSTADEAPAAGKEESSDVSPEATGDDPEDTGEVDINEPSEDVATLGVQKALGDIVAASFQAYHETVVEPLLKRLEELDKVNKSLSAAQEATLSSLALLPPSATAANIRKAFTTTDEDPDGNQEATTKEVNEAVTDVAEETEQISAPKTPLASGNLLADF